MLLLLAWREMPAAGTRPASCPTRSLPLPSRFPSIRRVLQSVFGLLLSVRVLRLFAFLTLADELPSDETTEEPSGRPVGGAALFHNQTWTMIPTLEVSRVYVHPWSEFPFDLSLVASPRIRASVSTPILANKHTPYTHLGAPLPAYPYKTRVGGSRSYEVPTTQSTLPNTKDVWFGGSTINAMLTHKTTPLPESFAGPP